MLRVVGVEMGLLRHDGEGEGVVMEDDAVLVLGIRGHARYAQAHVGPAFLYGTLTRALLEFLKLAFLIPSVNNQIFTATL